MKALLIKASLLTLVLVVLNSCTWYSNNQTSKLPTNPNIIFILADDLGWSDIGAYGSEINTPNLDRLAYEGIRFTRFYNTSKCFPTRGSLLTGLYQQQIGMDKRSGSTLKNSVTLAEVLKTAGYRTLFSGKYHGKDIPVSMGFDHAYGLLDGAINYFNPGLKREGEAEPARKRFGRLWVDDDEVFKTSDPDKQDYFPKGFYTTDAFTDKAIEYLKKYQDEDQPFFLHLTYTAPHDPLMAFESDIAKYRGKYNEGYEAIRQARYKKQLATGLINAQQFPLSKPTYPKNITEDQIKRMEVYAAMIDRMDQNIGRLIKQLEESGKLDNTLILFASDNGASAENVDKGEGEIGKVDRWSSLQSKWANVANTPFRFYKNYSYNGGTQSPLIAFWPKGIKSAGRVSHAPLHLIDVMPSVIELSDAVYPRTSKRGPVPTLPGQSFIKHLAIPTQNFDRPPLYFSWRNGHALIDYPWKIVTKKNEPWSLFNLEQDSTETKNLANTNPQMTEQLVTKWNLINEKVNE